MPDNGPSVSVPDELVEVAARAVAHTGYSFRPESVARAVLSAVSEAGWVIQHRASSSLPYLADEALTRERDEARAQAEALAEALEDLIDHRNDYPTDLSNSRAWDRAYEAAWDRLRAFRESKETGDVR